MLASNKINERLTRLLAIMNPAARYEFPHPRDSSPDWTSHSIMSSWMDSMERYAIDDRIYIMKVANILWSRLNDN